MRKGSGFLAVWAEPPAKVRPEYLNWLVREHLPQRVGTAGFLNGRIFQDVKNTGQFFVAYETSSADVLKSSAYLDRLQSPTVWTQKMVKKLNPIIRGTGDIVRSWGQGWGGIVAALRFDGAGVERVLREEVTQDILSLHDFEGVVSVRVLKVDPDITNIRTRERSLRPIDDRSFSGAVMIEGIATDHVSLAVQQLFAICEKHEVAIPDCLVGRMQYGLDEAELDS